MGSASNYLENKMLDAIIGGGFTKPATVYCALFTADPTDAASGAEVSGGSYARVSITNNTTNWPNASSGQKKNGTEILFAAATGAWGTVTHWALFDASTSGNMLFYGALTNPLAPTSGKIVRFKANTIAVTLTGVSDYLKNKMLDAVLGAGYTRGELWIALCTSEPTDAAAGTEVSGNGYARVQASNDSTTWPDASGGQKQNGAELAAFPAATGSWGTITHWELYTAVTSGERLFYGALASSIETIVGCQIALDENDVTIALD